MEKIVIGVPAYGGQVPSWWSPLAVEAKRLIDDGVDLVDVIDATSMATDYNRNSIVRRFLETDADWLFWLDSDNPLVQGAITRLLQTHKAVVSGLYVTGAGDPKPVAYQRTDTGTYRTIVWNPGEIIPVDAVGMGHLLTHRSVYEKLEREFVCLQRDQGGLLSIHVDDITGDIFEDAQLPTDDKVIDGVLHQRLRYPDSGYKLPFFAHQYGRTEDIFFCEMVKRAGIDIWVDTSIEVGHLKMQKRDPKEYFEWLKTL